MRKTKIVCTIGPASTDEKIITDIYIYVLSLKAGMNIASNFYYHICIFISHLIR